LTPNDPYSGRTAPLTSKRCILYIYSTNIGTEYFKHDIYSPFFSLQNAVCFIILTYLVPVLFAFYIQGVLKLKNNNSDAKSLIVFRLKQKTLPQSLTSVRVIKQGLILMYLCAFSEVICAVTGSRNGKVNFFRCLSKSHLNTW